MSVWKKFCRTVESKAVRRHFGDLVPMIETCAVFEFTAEQIAHAVDYTPDNTDVPPFPFPRMCCLGPGGVLVFQSPEMDTGTGVLTYEMIMSGQGAFVTGKCTVRPGCMEAEVTGIRGIAPRYFDETSPARQALDPGALAALQELRRVDSDRADEFEMKITAFAEKCERLERERIELGIEAMRAQFRVGLQEIRWINKPDHYTVEVGPSAPRRKGKRKPGRITRLAERSRHIVLTKNEIAEAWHRVHRGGTHASPLPHLRRGHYRTLRAERYGESKGKRVWVRATHVNGQCVEWRDGDVRYRVV